MGYPPPDCGILQTSRTCPTLSDISWGLLGPHCCHSHIGQICTSYHSWKWLDIVHRGLLLYILSRWKIQGHDHRLICSSIEYSWAWRGLLSEEFILLKLIFWFTRFFVFVVALDSRFSCMHVAHYSCLLFVQVLLYHLFGEFIATVYFHIGPWWGSLGDLRNSRVR